MDLSKFNRHNILHAKSSHKNILVEYGLKEPRKKKDRPIIKHEYIDKQESEKDTGKQRQKAEKNLQVLKDLEVLKRYYYNQYMDLLRERVKKQHETLKQQESKVQSRLQTPTKFKLRQTKHVLTSNQAFLDKISKSQAYMIVSEVDKMKQAGSLKTSCDVDAFWMQIMNKSSFPGKYDKGASRDIQSKRNKVLPGRSQSRNQVLGDIEEDEDGSIMSCKLPTAKSQSRQRSLTGKSLQKQRDNDELKFPKAEMPKLHCFDMEFSQKEEDPAKLREDSEHKALEKERWIMRKQLHKMHQLAMSNTASALRIFQKHDIEDLQMMMDSSNVQDLIDVDYFIDSNSRRLHDGDDNRLVPYGTSDVTVTSNDPHTTSVDSGAHRRRCGGEVTWTRGGDKVRWLTSRGRENTDHRTASPTLSTPNKGDRIHSDDQAATSKKSDSTKSSTRIGCRLTAAASEARTPDMTDVTMITQTPLTLQDILPGAKIMEAKCLSTLWTNYMKAKSSST